MCLVPMLSPRRQHRREGRWDGAKDPEGIGITLIVVHGRFSQSESLVSRDVEQIRSKTAAHLQTRLLVLTGTVK
jgi:hypothetical protein